MTARCVLVLSFTLLSPSLAGADCIQQTARMVMRADDAELVFSGTVVELTKTAPYGYRATLEVERVWKGVVTARFDLHFSRLAPEIDHYEVGRSYVVLAHRLVEPRMRSDVGLESSDVAAFVPTTCGDQASLVPTIKRDLGRGRPPK